MDVQVLHELYAILKLKIIILTSPEVSMLGINHVKSSQYLSSVPPSELVNIFHCTKDAPQDTPLQKDEQMQHLSRPQIPKFHF